MGPAALSTRHLTKVYPGTRALDGVSVSFEPGKVAALIGRNGAGKSTLLGILSGAVLPTEGEVLLGGRPLRLRSPHDALARGIATVHQELSLVPQLSVGENVLVGRLPKRRGSFGTVIDWKETWRRSRAILDVLGIDLDVRQSVSRLGLARRQMVEIARALSFDPSVVLLDEPTSGLARAEVEKLFALVRSLAKRGVVIVYVTHRLQELGEIADTVTVLRDGHHTATMTASEATPKRLVSLLFGEKANEPLDLSRAAGAEAMFDAQGRAAGAELLLEPQGRAAGRGSVLEARDRAAASEPVLEARGLAAAGLVTDVNLRLARGEVLGLAGMLGSGRTELLLALFGAIPIERGEIFVEGRRVIPRSPRDMTRRGIALVPEDRQRQGLAKTLSARENFSLASLERLGRRWILRRADERRALAPLARDLELLLPDAEAPVARLSGGNQQKIVLAKWLAASPKALLLDEPTRGIDLGAKRQIFETVRSLARRGTSSLFVSSEFEELVEVCDRVLVLRGGRIAAELGRAELSLERLFSLSMAA